LLEQQQQQGLHPCPLLLLRRHCQPPVVLLLLHHHRLLLALQVRAAGAAGLEPTGMTRGRTRFGIQMVLIWSVRDMQEQLVN
jgi:hypothetical protein